MTATTESRPKRKRTPAPWRSRTIRVPVELHPQVMAMSAQYKSLARAAARKNQTP